MTLALVLGKLPVPKSELAYPTLPKIITLQAEIRILFDVISTNPNLPIGVGFVVLYCLIEVKDEALSV